MGWFQHELSSQYQSELAVQKQMQVRSKCSLLLYVLPRNHLKRVNLLPDHTYCIPNLKRNHATLAIRFLFSTITKRFSNIYQCKSEECGRKSESAWELIIMRAISSTLFIIYEAKWSSWTRVLKQCVWAKGINIDTNIDKATWLWEFNTWQLTTITTKYTVVIKFFIHMYTHTDTHTCVELLWRLSGKESVRQCRRTRDVGLIPGLRRSGGENGNPLQYSCLKNSMDRGSWQATAK